MENSHDELLRTLSGNVGFSVRVLTATHLVREAVRRHATSPTASVALGRALMGTLLLATETQDGERVQLRLRGDGPLGAITVTADSSGAVRGYVQHPSANPPLRGATLGLSAAIGLGSLAIERNHPRWKQPYSGIVSLVSGEIAEDLVRYLLESEQKPSALALGIYLGASGEIEAAGGYLIQRLPGADELALAALEQRVSATVHPAELMHAGAGADAILAALLEGLDPGTITRLEPHFACPCDLDRVRRAAMLLGREELREIAASGEDLEVRCAFCAEVYHLAPDTVGSLLPDA